MLSNIEWWTSWWTIAAAIFTIVSPTAVYVYFNTIKPKIDNFKTISAGIVKVVDSFPDMSKNVAWLTKEFTPNGGSSAIDKININSKNLAEMRSQQGQQTSMLLSVMATLPEAIVWTDHEGDPSAVSKGFTAMTGMDIESMQKGGWRRMVHPDDLEMVDKRWLQSLENKEMFFASYRIRNILRPDRGFFKISVLAIILPLDGGWKATFEREGELMTVHEAEEIKPVLVAEPSIVTPSVVKANS